LATEQLRQELVQRQEALREARSEAAFYRGILVERDGVPGPRLHRFTLDPAAGRLDLVLVQGRPGDETTAGHLEVRLVDGGAEEGDPAELHARFAPLARIAYRFDFFQELELDLGLHLASGVFLVSLIPEGKEGEPRHYVRRWPLGNGIAGPPG
jgi:hypothetical protein